MFNNKQVTQKTNDMEINVVAKNTLITGELPPRVISESMETSKETLKRKDGLLLVLEVQLKAK